ncbi:sodium/hydrogen exchanger 3 [Schistocerca americana]|uniref:sodium/hydrogen exchanger 3 n=1 Tax=Schistocerca americana TaxID=7009 RepID=UPI001F4F8B4A|nr:sodium/hydrogen exchanger 3 [Schistocerca americana]
MAVRRAVAPQRMLLQLLLLAAAAGAVAALPDAATWSVRPVAQQQADTSSAPPPQPLLHLPTTSTDGPAETTSAVSLQDANPTPAEEQHDVKRYAVSTVEFERVQTPFIIGLWIFSASVAKIAFHMAPKVSKMFPESCLLIVVGLLIGAILFYAGKVHVSTLTPDIFFLYMLPPIILDAGYFMPNRLFFDHLGTILLFAVVGTIFNTLTIGLSLWAAGQTDLFGCETPLLDMFLFSALISAVDPVAVLAVFEEIHVNEILYIVVFGESLLNDAVTVVLYHMFESYTEMGPENIIYTDVLAGLASFFVVALGGTIIGIIWGFLTGLVTRYTHQVRVIEPIFIFVMAYLAYLNAEIFHMSGILAITFCGITMKNYVEANISHKSHTTVKYAMKMLSSSSETIIFMFLGVATVNDNHNWNTWFVVLTVAFCSVYRTIGVILLTAIANHFRLHQLTRVDKFVMSYGGLRGAVAFALVLLIDRKHVPLQPMFVTTTIAVIYFTVFIQGITIKPLVRILNVKRAEKRKPTMNERIHERLMDHVMAGIEDILGQHGNYHLRDKFKRFDNKFIRPYLLRDHQGAEPKILETYSKLAMKDAMDYMRRNASTVGNISGTESMSAIFRNFTSGNINGNMSTNFNGSFNHLDSSTWNIDMQELEYNPSKKDLTDAKIHHLLAEELCKPYRRHRRLSYSRHAVNDRDLSTQVNYRMHMNIRRMVGERKHHHKRSKRLGKDGKQNHVSFPGITQNGSAKQFTHDYITEVLQETENDTEIPKSASKEDWDSAITFTAKSSYDPVSGGDGLQKKMSRDSDGECARVTTPTATETMLPWKRDDEGELSTGPVKQSEFPAWCSNKEYLAYNSPSATFLGGIEQPKVTSVIGLFRRESAGSVHQESRASSESSLRESPPPTSNTVLLIEEPVSLPGPGRRPPTARRGSMLELGSSVNPIPEEDNISSPLDIAGGNGRWPTVRPPPPRLAVLATSSSSSSSSSSLESSADEEEKAVVARTHK